MPDVGYTEVIAVASDARGAIVRLPQGRDVSLGELMIYAIFKQMLVLGRHPRTFVRVVERARAWNMPPINTLSKGDFSQINETEPPPFEEWWAAGADLFS